MAYRIVDDVPMPPQRSSKIGAGGKSLFADLEVGQAIIFDKDDEGWRTTPKGTRYHTSTPAASYYGKRNGKKFSGRVLPDGSFGIWRTA